MSDVGAPFVLPSLVDPWLVPRAHRRALDATRGGLHDRTQSRQDRFARGRGRSVRMLLDQRAHVVLGRKSNRDQIVRKMDLPRSAALGRAAIRH